jgi:hypothetical protein
MKITASFKFLTSLFLLIFLQVRKGKEVMTNIFNTKKQTKEI